ncbi:MAG: hypothetical protein SF187_23975 [Deltaproteobacteria bacterium]|nr:hypothetical protein [Deltaproteobacteria bacterium]
MNRPRFSVPAATTPPPPTPPARAMTGWRARLAQDPIPRLLREGSPAVVARVRRDLMEDDEAPTVADIWAYKEVQAFAKKIAKTGCLPPKPVEKAMGGAKFAAAVAGIKTIDKLADYGVRADDGPKQTPLHKAADFLLSSQGEDGGIADLTMGETPADPGKMPAIHFQGWAVSALCRAGFDDDPRVDQAFAFLLANRQNDGGWAWRGVRTDSAARPSSHLITGMVLRAFASSKKRKTSREARRAAELLATRFLQPDRYPDRKEPKYWEDIQEPRVFVDVADALDSVTSVGLGKENSGVRTAEAYLRGRQAEDGFWYPGPTGKVVASELSDEEKEAAVALTLRVLVMLRRIN